MSDKIVKGIASLSIELEEPDVNLNSESLKYWIHCNCCLDLYVRKKSPMFLLSCQHVLCENCLKKGTNQTLDKSTFKCSICLKVVRGSLIGNDMPSYLKELFHSTPWLKDLPTARIMEFQEPHRENIRKAMEVEQAKYDRLVREEIETAEIEKKLTNELRLLKHNNLKLERRIRPLLKDYAIMRMESTQHKMMSANSGKGPNELVSACARTARNPYTRGGRTFDISMPNFGSIDGQNTNKNAVQQSLKTRNTTVMSFNKNLPSSSSNSGKGPNESVPACARTARNPYTTGGRTFDISMPNFSTIDGQNTNKNEVQQSLKSRNTTVMCFDKSLPTSSSKFWNN